MINDWSINQKDPSKLLLGVEDIKQCHENILFTIPGSRPFDNEFGSTLWKYIDSPVNESFAKAAFELKQSLNKFEKRTVVSKVTRVIDGSTNLLNIEGIYTSTGESFVTKIDLNKVYTFEPTFLNIDNQSLCFISSGESISISISSNKAWTLTSKPSWITVSANSGNEGLTTISVTAPLNSGDVRTGSMTFLTSDNKVTTIVALAQAKKVYTYGRLYNWYAASSRSLGMLYNRYAATDSRNIAPVGWHVPSMAEFDTLIAYLGGASIAGGKLKETGETYWIGNIGATNEVGFSALMSKFRTVEGIFANNNEFLCWTSSINGIYGYAKAIQNYSAEIFGSAPTNSEIGASIRLIKDDSTDTGIMTGNDGKKYATVKIGTQVWMSENLEETKFRNGDTIPVVTDNTAWAALTTAGICWYNNTRTYNLAPVGWHIPNQSEYEAINTYLASNIGIKLKEAGTDHWQYSGAVGTNESGFTALPAGIRESTFSFLQTGGFLQTSTKSDASTSIGFSLYYNSINFAFTYWSGLWRGQSVRFVRNKNSVLTANPTDAEGNEYDTVTIGTQTFTKQNHKSKKWRTGEDINTQLTYTDAEWQALTAPACCAYNNDEANV